MSVELSPSASLGFHRPLTQLVKRTLTVSNPNSQPVAFKVKTTAPKAFCVRPNSGRIEPGERVEVQVLLQPMKEEPAPGAKCRDKFLIQSALITIDKETKGLAELWQKIEADHKSGAEGVIHEQKIRCAFLPAVDGETGSTPANDSSFVGGSGFTNGVGTPSASRFDTVKSGNEGTPYHAATTGNNGESDITGTASTFSAPPYDTTSTAEPSSPSPASGGAPLAEKSAGVAATAQAAAQSVVDSLPKSTEEVKQVATNAAASISNAASSAAASAGLTSASTSTTGTRSAVSGSTDITSQLQQELQTAKAEIARIKKLLAQKEDELASGLRQRNVAGSSSASQGVGSSGSQTMLASTTQNGIPIEMVAAIAAGVFVFTWLFF